jgi:hypothetical protein
MDNAAVGLADAIAALRRELTSALESGRGEDIRFRLGPVELEFELDVTRELKAGGGVQFWVVSLDGSGQRSNSSRHHIKLSLQPVGPDNADINVASQQTQRPP